MSYRNILYAFGPKQELTPGASITWAFDGRPAFVEISENGTLTVTGPLADFPMVGLMVVHHTVAGTTLSLTGDSSNVVWSTGAGQHTVLEFTWDGTEYVWTSRTKSATAALTQLDTPADFTATPSGSDTVILAWGDVTGETNFEIQRALLADKSDAALLNSPAADVLTYNNTTLDPETDYYYRIRAVGDGTTYASSAWSAWVLATTGAAGAAYAYRDALLAQSGVIGVWGLDEAAGATAFNDESTNNLDGAKVGTFTSGASSLIASEPSGKAVDFANGGLIEIAHHAAISFASTGAWSVVWNMQPYSAYADKDYICKIDDASPYYGWTIYIGGSQNLILGLWGPGGSRQESASIASYINNDAHYAVTYNNGTIKIYVNGVLLSSSALSSGTPGDISNTNPLCIGGRQNTSARYGNAIIDGVALFNTELSATDITNLYNASL